MHQHTCRTALRRTAALGAAAVVVAVGSSAFGIGTATASAAEPTGTNAITAATKPTNADPTNAGATNTDTTSATAPESAADTTAAPAAAAPASTDSGTAAPRPTADTPAEADAANADAGAAAPTATAPVTGGSGTTSPAPTVAVDQPSAAATPAGTVTVSGSVKRLRTLTAETAGWPAGTTFTYQWLHSYDGGPLVEQVGATTERTFVIGSVEGALDRYAVRVTGTAPGAEPTTVISETTAPVDEAPENRWGLLGFRSFDLRVGESSSISLAAFDGDGLVYSANDSPNGAENTFQLPDGLRLAPDGTLSGTPTRAQVVEFWLHTSSSIRPDGGEASRVELVITPGQTESLNAVVRGSGTWLVRSDGSTEYSRSPEVQDGDPTTPLRVRDGETVEVDLLTLDRNGDLNVDPQRPTWSSSVDADVLETTSAVGTPVISARFVGAGDHRITARLGDLTLTFTVQVVDSPATSTTATTGTTGTTAATTHTQHPTTDSLAYTGVETGTPIGWALGLLAAGGGLLLHRARRRA
ncbi:hypothetical protein [Curtobacterium oceanosedimentum]|uniref:Gram-positive cocci surface proteins LPxTG domain-containing protein n=1 Tax=Curtobacterium oceanosedimentum TaxID=465820 RepID=A0A147DRF1_9MICO|nr:hypothetical protein [Curtobacterium oceanosedimentum]KTR52280.1 hypothetical protein NS359_07025 [Curtobacterium oceanosedimentum]